MGPPIEHTGVVVRGLPRPFFSFPFLCLPPGSVPENFSESPETNKIKTKLRMRIRIKEGKACPGMLL